MTQKLNRFRFHPFATDKQFHHATAVLCRSSIGFKFFLANKNSLHELERQKKLSNIKRLRLTDFSCYGLFKIAQKRLLPTKVSPEEKCFKVKEKTAPPAFLDRPILACHTSKWTQQLCGQEIRQSRHRNAQSEFR